MAQQRDVGRLSPRTGDPERGHPGVATALGVAVLDAVTRVVARLPVGLSLWAGRRLGDVVGLVARRHRQVALRGVGVAFPELGAAGRRRLAGKAWQHLGMMMVELTRLLGRPVEATLREITVTGDEHLHHAMREHGRALVLTAHLGNWEYLAVAHRLVNIPLSVVVRPLDAPLLDAWAERMRRHTGAELIAKRGALREVLGALRRGRMVAVLLDQNATRREGVFVPFFGRPASTSRSLALLAVRTATPVVPIFITRLGPGRHRVTVLPAIPPPAADDDLEAAVVALTARCTAIVETAIRQAPDQWLWAHDRWRTRPPQEGA